MASQPVPRLTPEEYLEIDRAADRRSEYLNGEMRPMAGASREHNLIVSNLLGELSARLRGTPWETLSASMRVLVDSYNYVYPDVVLTCAPRFADARSDILLNPHVIVEVLSPITEGDDRVCKFQSCRRSETLQDYIMVAQDRPFAEHYSRYQQDLWLLREAEGLDAVLSLPSIGCELRLAEIYERIEFPETLTDG